MLFRVHHNWCREISGDFVLIAFTNITNHFENYYSMIRQPVI